MLRDLQVPPRNQRRKEHERIGRPVPHLLTVVALRCFRLQRQRRPAVGHQLLTYLVHADQWSLWIEGTVIDLQTIFHATDELGIGFWGAPTLLQSGFEQVF
jgi:hypothetical protein